MDSEGEYWRAYVFIENTVSYDLIDNPEILYEGGLAFGRFQSMLADYPAKTLHETIPGFHDTRERFETFKKGSGRGCVRQSGFGPGGNSVCIGQGKKLWTAFRIC